MRKTLLLALLFSALLCRAQNYRSFFGQHKTEYKEHTVITCYDNREDTVPNPNLLGCGATYTFTVHNQDTVQKNGRSYMPVDGFWWYDVYLREDASKGQLFLYYPDYETEILMCDMSLNVGDTFVTPYSPYFWSYSDDISLVVDSVFYMDGLKTIKLRSADGYYFQIEDELEFFNIGFYFIEGTGPVYGPVAPINEYGLDLLLCMLKDDTLTYMASPILGCDQWYLPINKYNKHSLVLYPNPSTGLLTLSLDNEGFITDGSIIILDISGRVVKSHIISSKKPSIDINLLKKGFYTLRYTNGLKETYVSKFIKM